MGSQEPSSTGIWDISSSAWLPIVITVVKYLHILLSNAYSETGYFLKGELERVDSCNLEELWSR